MLKKFLSYIAFWQPQQDNGNSYLKAMHRINKISILLFLIAIIVLIIRLLSA